jgi:hypothetical protein
MSNGGKSGLFIMDNSCQSCHAEPGTRTAVVNGKYYAHIGLRCLGQSEDTVSSNAAGNERRRQYEDFAQDTIQPFDAKGPNPEFFRMYPASAAKVFTPQQIEDIKRKL